MGKRPQMSFEYGKIADMGVGLQDCPIEALIVVIDPLANSGEIPLVHTGHELVFCLQGKICYQVNDSSYNLEPGDSLFFEAYLPHRWHNPCPKSARTLLILCPADMREKPTTRLFKESNP
jgi:uncharacterized cupin superfamily protein